MPATYRKQGKGSADYVRKTWAPAPQQPPKPKQYFVLGMEVDHNTYREYNYEKTWTIDGDVLKGFTVTLWTLEHYATEEHAKDYPIEAANARKILDQIRDEITVIINRKDNKNMTEPKNSRDFIKALQDIYTESRAAYAALQGKVDAAEVKMNRAYDAMRDPACKNKELAAAQYDVAKSEHKVATFARNGDYRNMIEDHEKRVKELRDQFTVYLDEHYAASPDKLDAATMQLLNSGICTAAELARLAERHADNPTMLRIVGSYAKQKKEEKHISSDDRMRYATVQQIAAAAKDGSRELAIFDSAVSAAAYGLGEDYEHATRMHSHIPEWLEGFGEQIQNLPVTPAEVSATGGNE